MEERRLAENIIWERRLTENVRLTLYGERGRKLLIKPSTDI